MFYSDHMDWAYAIERHRKPPLSIVATLCAIIGLADGGIIERLSWPVYRTVLAVLRPAESAVRRLIVVAAQGLALKPRTVRPLPAGMVISGKGQGRRCFRLFDPRVRHQGRDGIRGGGRRIEPRIRVLDFDPRIPLFRRSAPLQQPQPEPIPHDGVNAVPLCRRLAAISDALSNLPRQARRYARWRARASAARDPRLYTVLRRGPPPYLRRRSSQEVHTILAECHWLARSLPAADTS
jgi:hypothetical protein